MTESPEFPIRSASAAPYVAAAALEKLDCLKHFYGTRKSPGDFSQLGLPRAPLVPRQKHGNGVAVVDGRNVERLQADPPEADALVTALRGVPLAVLTADCLGIVICDQRMPALAVVHAGWRGTVRSVLWKTVLTMFETFGTRSEDCIAAVGPAIAGPCYEVGEDVRSAFVKGLPYGQDVLTSAGERRWRADLREANRRQLLDARVPPGQISICPYCTHCEAEWFHSFRRDASSSGRQVTVAMLV